LDLNSSPEEIDRIKAGMRQRYLEMQEAAEKSRRLRVEAFIQRRTELNSNRDPDKNSFGMFNSQKTNFRSQSTMAWYSDGTFLSEGHEVHHWSKLLGARTRYNYSIQRFCFIPRDSLSLLSQKAALKNETELQNRQQKEDLLALRVFADPRSAIIYQRYFKPEGDSFFGIEDNWIVRDTNKQVIGIFDNGIQAITFSYHFLMCNLDEVKVLETYCPPHDCGLHGSPQDKWLDNHPCIYMEEDVTILSELLQRKCDKIKMTSHDELFHRLDLALMVLRFEQLDKPDQWVHDSDFGQLRNALLGDDELSASITLAVSKIQIGIEKNLVDAYLHGEISLQEFDSQVNRHSNESLQVRLDAILSKDYKHGEPF
jgi:hypothetical protein